MDGDLHSTCRATPLIVSTIKSFLKDSEFITGQHTELVHRSALFSPTSDLFMNQPNKLQEQEAKESDIQAISK